MRTMVLTPSPVGLRPTPIVTGLAGARADDPKCSHFDLPVGLRPTPIVAGLAGARADDPKCSHFGTVTPDTVGA